MISVLNWVRKNRENDILKILLSVITVVILITFFYYLYFQGKIVDNYIVRNYNIDGAIKLTSSDSIDLYINKPFDQLYLPIAFFNTDNISITINDGESINTTIVSTVPESIAYLDINEPEYMSFFEEHYSYYYMEGTQLSADKLQSYYTISISSNTTDGFILIGTSGSEVAYRTTKDTKVNYLIFAIVTFIFVIGTIILKSRILNKADILELYTVIAILLGGIYFTLFPAACTNDSRPHIIQTYECVNSLLGHSDWNTVNGDPYRTIYRAEDGYIIDQVLWNTERLYASPDTKMYDEALYTPLINISNDETVVSDWHTDISDAKSIQYLPFIVVLLIARLFNINLMLSLNFAKLASFLCYLFMIRFAIKLMPYGKEALAIYALSPMIMQSMISFSYDLFCIGGAFIAFAYVLKIASEVHKYTWKDLLIILFLILVLLPAKGGVYFACFVFLLFFIIIYPYLKKNPKYLIPLGGVLVIVGAIIAVKFEDIKVKFMPGSPECYSLNDFIENPVETVRYMIESITTDADMFLQGIFGGRLGWNEAIVPWFVVIMYIILFLVSCQCRERCYPRGRDKAFCLIALILFGLGINFIFLLGTVKGTPTIFGPQGRYFAPIIPIIICICKGKKFELKFEHYTLYSSLWIISVIHIMMIMQVYLRR